MAECEENLNSLLMKVKEESETFGLNSTTENEDHGISSHHFMANRTRKIRSNVRFYFIFLGSKIPVNSYCSSEIKRMLLL